MPPVSPFQQYPSTAGVLGRAATPLSQPTPGDYILVQDLPEVTAGAVYKYRFAGLKARQGAGYYYELGGGIESYYPQAIVEKSHFFQKRLATLDFDLLPLEVQNKINIYEHSVITLHLNSTKLATTTPQTAGTTGFN